MRTLHSMGMGFSRLQLTAIARHRSCPSRRALSLLEAVLALSILGISVAILSRVMQLSADNGLRARRITQAQMLCESKMNEAVLGAIPLQNVSWTPATLGVANSQWYYMLQTIATQQPNMVGIVVSVTDTEGLATPQKPLARLVQWIINPNLGLDTPTDSTTSSTGGTTTGGSGSQTSAGGMQ